MEDLYFLNHDCMSEFSHIIVDKIILFRFSCSLKANKQTFVLPRLFIPNNKYQPKDVKKFTRACILDLRNTTKCIRLDYFKNLEKLTISKWNPRSYLHDPMKLTYLHHTGDKDGSVNLDKYKNLKYLNHTFIPEINTLINLQSLTCSLEEKLQYALDFHLLSNLTKLSIKLNIWHDAVFQHVILFEDSKFIELHAKNIDFLKKQIEGNSLKHLDLHNTNDLSFSNLKSIQLVYFQNISNICILNQDDSYRCLTLLKINMDDNVSMNFKSMINLKDLDISHYKSSQNVDLSFLTSLEKLHFEHNTRNNINMIHLTKLTYLHFVNYVKSDHIIQLPRNIICLFFHEHSKQDEITVGNTWTYNMLIQIHDIQNLKKLMVYNLSFERNNLNSIKSTSLTKLIIYKGSLCYSDHLTNLKHLVLTEIDINGLSFRHLTSVKILTLKRCTNVIKKKLLEFHNLEDLRFDATNCKLELGNITRLTNLKLYVYNYSHDIELEKLYKLKKLSVSNMDAFLKLCANKFPMSLKDIYIKINKKDVRDACKLFMKDINLHFVERK